MTDNLVSATKLAKAFRGKTLRRIRQLAEDGVIPKAGRGKFDWIAATAAFLEHEEQRLIAKFGGETESLRVRKMKAQAEMAEMDAAQRSGRMLDSETVARKWENIGRNTMTRLLGMPSKAAPQVVALKTVAEIKDALEALIHECLHDLSADANIDADAKVPARAKAPAKAKRKRVGRRKPKAKLRGKRRAR